MGIMKWLARKGAVGGTARWAADQYINALERGMLDLEKMETPEGFEAENRKVLLYILEQRYARLPHPEKLHIVKREVKKTKGLMGLVIAILKVEAGLHENAYKPIAEMLMIIYEELMKKGIGKRVILGTDDILASPAAFMPFARTSPAS